MGDPPEEETALPLSQRSSFVTQRRKKEAGQGKRERGKKVGEKRTVPSVEFSSVSFLFDGREQEDRGIPPPSRAIIISPG